jgi:hypothetical protein
VKAGTRSGSCLFKYRSKTIVFDDGHINLTAPLSAAIPVFLGYTDPIITTGADNKGLELIHYLRLMHRAISLTDRYKLSIYLLKRLVKG